MSTAGQIYGHLVICSEEVMLFLVCGTLSSDSDILTNLIQMTNSTDKHTEVSRKMLDAYTLGILHNTFIQHNNNTMVFSNYCYLIKTSPLALFFQNKSSTGILK